MANAYYGKEVIAELSDAQTLPNATSADSTNMAYVGGDTGGRLVVSVYANTDITIATGQAFNIELEAYTADTAASATPPFSTKTTKNNDTAENDAHYYLLHKTSSDGELEFSAGDLITQCILPMELLEYRSYDWVQLKYTTDADESSEKVDAFLHALI